MQKKINRIIFAILSLFSLALPNNNQVLQLVEQELIKTEKNIDIGYLCLLLSKDAFPELDIQKTLYLFDGMARNVAIICETSKDKMSLPDKRIGSMNTFLFRPGPWNAFGPKDNMVFSYDEKSDKVMQPKALFIPYMLESKKGTCSTMPTLWYIIADRLGWPINAVRGPGHIWVKYHDIVQGNIEATPNGGYIPDSQYIQDMQISANALKNKIYMQPLSKKQFISTMLVNNAYYSMNVLKDTVKTESYLKLAIKLDTLNTEALRGLGVLTRNSTLVKKAVKLGLTSHEFSKEFYQKRKPIIQK
jgi:hypothetical protein